jgi:hypothetical protein
MTSTVLSSRLPRSGSAALASAALMQAVLGAEFVLAGLNKFVDAEFTTQFRGFVTGSPGATSGPLAWMIQSLVLPNVDAIAELSRATELGAGGILLVTAVEVLRRRLSGPIGAQHGYEPLLALVSAAAAFALGGVSLVIFLIEGGRLPMIGPAYAFSSPITVELLLVPFTLAIAWIELARFFALRNAID